jgi:hypothetical protein
VAKVADRYLASKLNKTFQHTRTELLDAVLVSHD